jgi:hypothetical protein
VLFELPVTAVPGPDPIGVLTLLGPALLDSGADPTGLSSPLGRIVVILGLAAALTLMLRWWWQNRRR